MAEELTVKPVIVAEKDIPTGLKKDERNLDSVMGEPVQSPMTPAQGWDPKVVEDLINVCAGLAKMANKTAGRILGEESAYLARHTSPVLDRYVPYSSNMVLVNCGVAWTAVGLKILYSIQREAGEKKKQGEPRIVRADTNVTSTFGQ